MGTYGKYWKNVGKSQKIYGKIWQYMPKIMVDIRMTMVILADGLLIGHHPNGWSLEILHGFIGRFFQGITTGKIPNGR